MHLTPIIPCESDALSVIFYSLIGPDSEESGNKKSATIEELTVPKPDKSTFDENWVFNIIVQNTEWNLDPDNSRKYFFLNLNLVFP